MKEIKTIEQFYKFIKNLHWIRKKIIKEYLKYKNVKDNNIFFLRCFLDILNKQKILNNKLYVTYNKDNNIKLDLTYELNELEKDLYFLENNEDDFYNYLEKYNINFKKELEKCVEFLKNYTINNFITDRDGTINNYSGRYITSNQSIYNSVFLTNFTEKFITNPVILTSAPMKDLIDVSINPKNKYIYAGSKGREYSYKNKKKGTYPISKEANKILSRLNKKLSSIVKQKEFNIFSLIGSGYQEKFGETVIARQDIYKSIPEEKSNKLLETVNNIVDEIDNKGDYLKIYDTGLDIEIILTIQDNNSNKMKQFDKSDGLKFLNYELKLGLDKHCTNLICGDTESDVALLKAGMDFTKNTISIFVTNDKKLIKEVKSICSNSFFVTSPDVLVSALNTISKTIIS